MAHIVDIPRLISKKRDGQALERNDILAFIEGVVKGTVKDDQLGAMLMAVYLNKMNTVETATLTEAMRDSGDVLSWPGSDCPVVDKHSTGGVGDKVSLVLAPALAACGMKVPMISGRGLGHTGGTLDKLESIEGYKVSLEVPRIQEMLKKVGCCIAGQTERIAPADKRLYASRDVTATVDDVALITGSIICKKAAEGLDALILDVKSGKGAWSICSSVESASQLANSLVSVGNSLGIKTVALVTDMDNPIGRMVGNSLEVIESIQCLQNEGPDDLTDLVAELGGHLLDTVQQEKNGKERILSVIRSGKALEIFRDMLIYQGVDSSLAANICSSLKNPADFLPRAKQTTELSCDDTGYVSGIHAMICAEVTRDLGAGRMVAGQAINHAVGLEFLVEIGSQVKAGDLWVRIYHDEDLQNQMSCKLQTALSVSPTKPQKQGRVLRKM